MPLVVRVKRGEKVQIGEDIVVFILPKQPNRGGQHQGLAIEAPKNKYEVKRLKSNKFAKDEQDEPNGNF